MSLIARLFRAPEAKASRVASLIALDPGRPRWSPRDYAALAREGYAANPVVHRCVRLIAEAAASVTWRIYVDGREAPDHALAQLLQRPNPRQSGQGFREALHAFQFVAGNAFIEAVAAMSAVRELHLLRPDRVKVVPGPDGWPQAFDYTVAGTTVRLSQGDGAIPPVLHLALFHPLDDHYGLSPSEAAAKAIDLHNAAAGWNKALLDNAARPSGALVCSGGATLSESQFERLKVELESGFSGAANAGRPLLLEGGLAWQPLSLSPKDMDFMEAKNAAARDIALAFGVPPMLLGIPGDNTYSNFAEANRAFWRQSVVPLVTRTADALAAWLSPGFADAPRITVDLDEVPALAEDREALWRRVGTASFLTDDEKREALGWEPRG
ncbi:phage portal protein [Blastochloris viridis]|uniref:Phage portal protein n=1 Tax=Blastochloris viridis TaxID=1079 RepID=A0A0H5BCJ6_BLAVI|nr:phage portal protein [Blastochloris viridis]ALK10133.1 Phage portal protein [Blastochloris viridis]BAR99937.1 phage portal protein [Blastochloris viridis]CUU42797.1 phage portal protein, HK97 family [Blastochloris viridis]